MFFLFLVQTNFFFFFFFFCDNSKIKGLAYQRNFAVSVLPKFRELPVKKYPTDIQYVQNSLFFY